jgi:hypothetical protein
VAVLPEFFTPNKKYKSVVSDAKGSKIVFEIEESAKISLAEVQEGLDKANALSKEAGTDVTFGLNRKELKFASKDNKVLLPLNPMDDPKTAKDAFPVANLREANGTILLEVVLEPGATLSLADAISALEKVKGASLKLSAVSLRADGFLE